MNQNDDPRMTLQEYAVFFLSRATMLHCSGRRLDRTVVRLIEAPICSSGVNASLGRAALLSMAIRGYCSQLSTVRSLLIADLPFFASCPKPLLPRQKTGLESVDIRRRCRHEDPC